jgi:glutamine amidotransferase
MEVLRVAIVDFGLGNLYSVQRACVHAGLQASITSDRREVSSAHAVLLPGVGAFGDAMSTLRRLDLVAPLREAAARGTPMLGICLGVQLLMSRSEEFGAHEGLDILKGTVQRFNGPREGDRHLKVPQIGWNGIFRAPGASRSDPWQGTPLEGQAEGEPMYFVHSYCVKPDESDVILSSTRYGQIEYCSGLRRGNLFAFQFHPERSGREGLKIYHAWARLVRSHSTGGAVS